MQLHHQAESLLTQKLVSLSVLVKPALFIAACISSASLYAETYTVSNQQEFNQAVSKLTAGDNVVLANGIWPDFEVVFTGNGRENAPISLSAQTQGQVILTGQSNLKLSGSYLHVSGLVFKDGFTPSNEVIAFRTSKISLPTIPVLAKL